MPSQLRYLEVVRKKNGLLYVKLNSPPVNALSSALMQELDKVLGEAEFDERVRVVVITGKGNYFSAGADIKKELAGLQKSEENAEVLSFIGKNNAILDRIEGSRKLVIAAINGPALGGGLELAMACHLRYAAFSGTKLALPEINLGVIPGWGGPWRLPKLVGIGRALEMMVLGKSIGAEKALEWGLVNGVFNSLDFGREVEKVAESFAGKSGQAIGEILKITHLREEEARSQIRTAFLNLLRGEDGREGVQAFLEKRIPKFK